MRIARNGMCRFADQEIQVCALSLCGSTYGCSRRLRNTEPASALALYKLCVTQVAMSFHAGTSTS